MRILLLSFYFRPDLCAGSFRCNALVDQLLSEESVTSVDVITTMPNRYISYSVDAAESEEQGKLSVQRISLPTHSSGMLDQINAFSRFYFKAIKLAKEKDYDVVVATSSRLFTAFLGKRVAAKKRLPLYLDIRDIFVDTLDSVLPSKLSFFLVPILNVIERYTFSGNPRVNIVSAGFLEYFQSRYPKINYDVFSNGIDDVFVEIEPQPKKCKASEDKVILYAGNIGESQGLHELIPKLSEQLPTGYRLQIIGDGGRKSQLVDGLKSVSSDNVTLLDPVERSTLVEYYINADILLLHLNDLNAFEKVLPSKIFEYAAFDKPILAGVSGYAAEFINKNVSGAEVFHPLDVEGAINALALLPECVVPRESFVKAFNRTSIMRNMVTSILSTKGKDNG